MRTHRSNRRRHADSGASFIELLVAVVILGTAGVGVLVAMSAAAVGARTSDEVSKAQSLLAESVGFLTDTDPEHIPYAACATAGPTSAYQQRLDALTGGSVRITAISYWNRTTSTFGAACRHDQGDRLQQITVEATTGDAAVAAVIVKRPWSIPLAGTVPAPPAPSDQVYSGDVEVDITPGVNG